MLPKEQLASFDWVASLMERYTTAHLVNETPDAFHARIQQFLELRDHEMEGYDDPARQRDLSIQFHWGHDHDFGDFKLAGRMADRHLYLISTFIDHFGLPRSLDGLRVLDIGCWTGGASMLLCAMGADVVAVEEVTKYAQCLSYVRDAFGLGDHLEVRNASLYELGELDVDDTFDVVLFAGVLYHVSDPVIALRTIFNLLKDGGTCFLETQAIDAKEPLMAYYGPQVNGGGTQEELNRWGWDWYVPSPAATGRMMNDTGFEDVRFSNVVKGRAFAAGHRRQHVDMLRAGLSVPAIR